jgi:hypothetical protein
MILHFPEGEWKGEWKEKWEIVLKAVTKEEREEWDKYVFDIITFHTPLTQKLTSEKHPNRQRRQDHRGHSRICACSKGGRRTGWHVP